MFTLKSVNTEYFIGKKVLFGYSLSSGHINRSHKLTFTREEVSTIPLKAKKVKSDSISLPSKTHYKATVSKPKQKFSAAELIFSTALDPNSEAALDLLSMSKNKPIRGRLPNNICDFLLPLMKKNIIRIWGNILYDIGPVNTFQDIPIVLYISVNQSIFSLVKHHHMDWNTQNATQELFTIKYFHDMLTWLSGDVSALNEEKKVPGFFSLEKNAPEKVEHNMEEEPIESNEVTLSIDDVLERKPTDDNEMECMGDDSIPFIAEEIRLKTYQKQAVHWMISREREIDIASKEIFPDEEGPILNSNGFFERKSTGSDEPKDENAALWRQVDYHSCRRTLFMFFFVDFTR